jgi:branched-chain amino acid aminotransferase
MMAISAQKSQIHLAIATWEWGSYFDPQIKIKGIRLGISKWKKPAPDSIPWDTKASGLYMISTLSKHEAEKNGYHDALMMDYQGNIAEATGANIFFINTKNNEIHTPIADSFLDGITRRSIIGIAKQLQIKVLERKIKLDELNKFDGCFLTGTAAEVTPVSQIGDVKFTVVDMIKKLDDDYSKLVNKN